MQQIANMMLQPPSLAVQQEEFADYAMAQAAASRVAKRWHRGAIELMQHKGRWFAVVDSESRIPKVKRGAA